MTEKEIRSIILVSSKHLTKRDYFELKRKKCRPSEFARALIASFEFLTVELNQIDYCNFLATRKDGSTYDCILCDDEYFDSNLESLRENSVVSNPFTISIDLCPETKGEIGGGIFTKEDLAEIKQDLYDYCSWLNEQYRSDFDQFDFLSHKVAKNSEDKTLEIKPTFKPEAIDQILYILNSHFSEEDQQQLKAVLKTGQTPVAKLFFRDSGKTLLDFFKQLMRGQFLTIAVQKDFEIWVSNGFEFLYQGNRKSITKKYASKIISGNERAAIGNRLIDIKSECGKFVIVQLEIKNRVQN